jgi:hypothetical protein
MGDKSLLFFTVGLQRQNLPELPLAAVPVNKLNDLNPLTAGLIDKVNSGKGHDDYKLS